MRDIKFHFIFKVKDELHHRFYSLDDLIEDSVRHLSDLPDQALLIASRQFTGLRDKNGKEIFEGDIVSKMEYQAAIDFRKGCFYAGLTLVGFGFIEDLEVIGNIYENPELLK